MLGRFPAGSIFGGLWPLVSIFLCPRLLGSCCSAMMSSLLHWLPMLQRRLPQRLWIPMMQRPVHRLPMLQRFPLLHRLPMLHRRLPQRLWIPMKQRFPLLHWLPMLQRFQLLQRFPRLQRFPLLPLLVLLFDRAAPSACSSSCGPAPEFLLVVPVATPPSATRPSLFAASRSAPSVRLVLLAAP